MEILFMVQSPIMEETPDLLQPLSNTGEPVEISVKKESSTLSIFGIVSGFIVLIILIAVAVYTLLQETTPTSTIRDIFIIFMALETLVIGIVLVILIIQVARLINLLQNEVKPILESTNETVNTLRGTTTFLSNNLVEPVMKFNEYFAGLQRLLKITGLTKK